MIFECCYFRKVLDEVYLNKYEIFDFNEAHKFFYVITVMIVLKYLRFITKFNER